MNFYKHHLGDYAAGTSHLTWDEDCAYRRLIDQYYKREAPIPAELKDACRLARAQTPAQRRAVESVLSEFFDLRDGGWHQKRCDEELAAANAQAETNRRIAEEREARKRERKANESLHAPSHEPSTNRSPATMGEREPSQTPDSTSQTPDSISPTGLNTSSTSYSSPPAVRLNGSPAAGLPGIEPPPPGGIPDCPHQRIRDLWGQLLPELQQPIKWTDARAAALRTRWREEAAEHKWTTEEDGLRVFAKLFRWCRRSDFLMGKAPTSPGRTAFSLTLPWLIKAENWAKVQEGNYHPEG